MTENPQTKVVATLSGGLDSTTMLYDLISQGMDVVAAISFDYGQRHVKELSYASATAERLGIEHIIVDMSFMADLLASSGSSLVSDTDVPEGHYAEDNMKATVVPNRNMIMLSIAGGIMVAKGASFVCTAVHAGDHFIYPDCRPRFINAASAAISLGNMGFGALPEVVDGELPPVSIHAPYLYSTKAEIALRAIELGFDLSNTWSCYKGGDIHCGRCGTCVERLEAIEEAAVAIRRRHFGLDPVEGAYYGGDYDTTNYEDVDFWKTAVAEATNA